MHFDNSHNFNLLMEGFAKPFFCQISVLSLRVAPKGSGPEKTLASWESLCSVRKIEILMYINYAPVSSAGWRTGLEL
ncbi:hypothetical protein BH23BAC3_BH23BAC3_03770 [soil metagenome]